MPLSSFLRHLGGVLVCISAWSTPSLVAQPVDVPAPLGVPRPGPTNAEPYAPQPIVQGGIVIPLYPPNSTQLNASRVREAEHYNLSKSVAGRISWITNIHNPSIEVHTVEGGLNTGAAVILAAGGGHRTLNVGSESADFVPFFHQYGVSTIILRNRLRADGYDVQKHAVNDALQAIRLVRAHAARWNIDPKRIGIMGFSAGALNCRRPPPCSTRNSIAPRPMGCLATSPRALTSLCWSIRGLPPSPAERIPKSPETFRPRL